MPCDSQARQQLLDFSRIEAGRVQASYEATDLAALTATSPVPSAPHRASRPAVYVECATPAAGLRRSGDVGKDRPQPCLECVQVHPRRRHHRSLKPRPEARSTEVRDTGSAFRSRAAPHLRAVPPGGRPPGRTRGHRHRPGSGAGTGKLHGGTITRPVHRARVPISASRSRSGQRICRLRTCWGIRTWRPRRSGPAPMWRKPSAGSRTRPGSRRAPPRRQTT